MMLQTEGWGVLVALLSKRREEKVVSMVNRNNSYEEFVSVQAAIRELDYLRAEPYRLIDQFEKESQSA